MFLWGLPLITIPVVIHLFHRRRQHSIGWGAMQFLMEAASLRRRFWQLSSILLMLLRIVAIMLFIFALARPLLKANWLGGAGPRDVILVFDTSMSTSCAQGQETRFDELLTQAEKLIGQLNDSDMLRVLLASSAPQWLTPAATSMDGDSKRQIIEQLRRLKPSLGSAEMVRCLWQAADADSANERATRVIAVLTDGQSYGWQAESQQAWEAFHDNLDALAMSAVVEVKLLDGLDRDLTNLSVESVSASRSFVALAEPIVLTVYIANRGDVATAPTLVSWFDGEDPIGVTSLSALEPGQTTTASIEYAFETPGIHEAICKLDRPDDLSMDNTGSLIVQVVETIPILVVDGRSESRRMGRETGFLLAALGLAGTDDQFAWKAAFAPIVVNASEPSWTDQLDEVDCVLLTNVSSLAPEAMEQLSSFVVRGGGLWIVLGDQLDQTWFNEALYLQGNGLAPLALDSPAGQADDFEKAVLIHPPTEQHPAIKLLADTERLDIDKARIYRRHRFVRSDDGSVAVLLRTVDGEPLVVENNLGRGRVIVQAIPLSIEWSNLPLCQSFVVMVNEYLSYLVEPTRSRWNLNPAEPLKVSLPLDYPSQLAEVRTPSGDSTEILPVVGEHSCTWRYYRTFWPGRYTLTLKSDDKAQRQVPFQVCRDTEESDLTSLTEEQIDTLAKVGGLKFVLAPLAEVHGDVSLASTEPLWPWLLVTLLMIMLLELLLSGQISRRGLKAGPPVQMDAAAASEWPN